MEVAFLDSHPTLYVVHGRKSQTVLHIQGWMTVWECYCLALEKGCLPPLPPPQKGDAITIKRPSSLTHNSLTHSFFLLFHFRLWQPFWYFNLPSLLFSHHFPPRGVIPTLKCTPIFFNSWRKGWVRNVPAASLTPSLHLPYLRSFINLCCQSLFGEKKDAVHSDATKGER